MSETRVVVVMGVSGAGKTTIGRLLAERLDWEFFDADDFHPESNRLKMASGEPLDDEDRRPWLLRLRELIDERLREASAVVTCSALKQSYRDLLGAERDEVLLVHLHGTPELLAERIGARSGHFMPASQLADQLATLEPPGGEALRVDVAASPPVICEEIVRSLDRLAAS